MRKSAKFLSIVLAAATAFATLSMVACNNTPPEEKHKHTYATTWSSDATNHWHAATCEHTDEKSDLAAHDKNGTNGTCSVCGYVFEHVHTFETTWEVDSDYHWHNATCEHYDLIDGKAKHDKNGANGSCSVCGYAPHVHTYATEWSNNDLTHWRATTCTGEYENHKYIFAGEAAYHDYDENFKCKVCGYQHEHPVIKYKAVDETGHWDIYDCIHQDITNKLNFQAHDTTGPNGACSVCGWLPIVETATDTNKHTHKFQWQWNPDSHWKKLNCGLKDLGCKSCDKGYYLNTAKNFDMGPHTYGPDGKCTVCGFNNAWRYPDECILCDVCGGCIKTVCTHENEAGHKKCGDNHGANCKRVTLEAEDGEVWSREEGKCGSIADYRNGKRECIHASYSNVAWEFFADKATTVTLRVHCGRTKDMFSDQGSIWLNGEQIETKSPCGQPSGEDSKCNPGWLTLGCMTLKEGTNRLELLLVGDSGYHLDKAELITDADVTIDFTPNNNLWLYEVGQWTPIPKAASATAAKLDAFKQTATI